MPKLCVFAGTTEGREIAEFLAGQSADVTVCVATEYGETLLPQGEGLHISARPLPREEMAELFRRERFDLVIDATHPYAKRITESIAATCAGTNTEYLRLLRPDTAAPENAVFVEDAAGAAEYLDRVDGNILLTTGSRELHAFASVRDFASRAHARVLPMEDSLRACREAGRAATGRFWKDKVPTRTCSHENIEEKYDFETSGMDDYYDEYDDEESDDSSNTDSSNGSTDNGDSSYENGDSDDSSGGDDDGSSGGDDDGGNIAPTPDPEPAPDPSEGDPES